MQNIHVKNEYSTLKKVILGNANELYFPDTHEIELETEAATWKQYLTKYVYKMLRRKKVPFLITNRFQKELANLKQVLEKHEIEVSTVESVVPTLEEEAGLGQMYARDSVMCVDDKLIKGQLQIEMRRKELRGYNKIIQSLDNKQNILSIPMNKAAYLEGGDVIVDYPNIYVGIGKYASNIKGYEWLKKQVSSDWTVIPIYLKNDGILHLDCCMTIIGPKTAIIHKESLQDKLPSQMDDFDFIEIDSKTRHQMGGNVLVIAPKKVIIQKRHKQLQLELEQRGFTVIPITFTWHALLDGAFRCATCPVERLND